jgi:lysophospholipase L1-like esterase
MFRQLTPPEPPHRALVATLVEAMLGDGPIDPALMQKAADPQLTQDMAKADADLRESDWANVGRYQAANAALTASGAETRIVFMGDSITEAWPLADPALFSDGRIGRGIAGQTSPQMLVRFFADVIALKPHAVHMLAGTNDIAGNTGPTTPDRYKASISAMLDIAKAHGLKPLIGSIPPAAGFNWRPGIDPRPWIAELNDWLVAEAAARDGVYIDYHAALVDDAGGLRAAFTRDGVHPNRGGYGAMRGVLERAIGDDLAAV